ncbi:MAG: DUF445 family protein, partial [Deltaproteobacteria bacterium]|nr:DUF445 family protein [Deltaproteobacteria bacterium]
MRKVSYRGGNFVMVLPDLLQPGLRVVFCGSAVGDRSAQRQAYYAGPGNRFWDILAETGLTPYRFNPEQYPSLLEYRIGLTDMVKRRSGQDAQLEEGDFDVAGFRAKIEQHAPKAVGFNGKKAAQVFFDDMSVGYGLQQGKIGNTALFVLPSTSGAARGFWESRYWHELARFVMEDGIRGSGEGMMKSTRYLGTISLCGAVAGFAGLTLLLRTGIVSGTFWKVLADAFEAGTIGAMADWFAVTALFREVSIPVLKRHTNIIVKNRARITDGIADMVQNRWLSPEVIRERLAKVSPSSFLVEQLDTPEKLGKAAGIVRDVLAKVAKSIDGPEVASFLERAIKDQLAAVEIHVPLGRWLDTALARGDHHAVWDLFLTAAEEGVTGPEVRSSLRRLFEEALEEYRNGGGFLRQVGIEAAKLFDVINIDEAVEEAVGKIAEFAAEAKGEPNHPIRRRLDDIFADYARRLSKGDPEAVASVDGLRRRLVENAELDDLIRRVLSNFRGTVEEQIARDDSDINRSILRFVDARVAELRDDPALRDRFDRWIRETAIEIVEKRHGAVGDM